MSNNPNAERDAAGTETTEDGTNAQDARSADDARSTVEDEPAPTENEETPQTPAQAAGEDEGASDLADAEDFFVARDEKGELLAVETTVGQYGQVVVRPMTYGHAQRYFGDAGGAAMAGPETVVNVIRNHVDKPNFDKYVAKNRSWQENRLTARIISEEMEPFGPAALIQTILEESGLKNVQVDMNEDGEAAIDFDAGN